MDSRADILLVEEGDEFVEDGTDHLAAKKNSGEHKALHDGLLTIASVRIMVLRASRGRRLAYADAQQDHAQVVDRQQHNFAVPFAETYFETLT